MGVPSLAQLDGVVALVVGTHQQAVQSHRPNVLQRKVNLVVGIAMAALRSALPRTRKSVRVTGGVGLKVGILVLTVGARAAGIKFEGGGWDMGVVGGGTREVGGRGRAVGRGWVEPRGGMGHHRSGCGWSGGRG